MTPTALVGAVAHALAGVALACAVACAAGCASAPSGAAGRGSDAASGVGAGGSDADTRATARAQLGELTHAASAYAMTAGHCARSIDDVAQPAPVDPWGHPVAYMPASDDSPAAFVSAGPDGALLTPDDITLSAPCSDR